MIIKYLVIVYKIFVECLSNMFRTCYVTTWSEVPDKLLTPSETPGEFESSSQFTILASASLQSEITIFAIFTIFTIFTILSV